MKPYERSRVPHVVFGNKTSLQTGKKLTYYGVKKCVIVTDAGVKAVGIVDPIVETIAAEGIEYAVYDKVQPDPPDYSCIECADLIREFGADGVVAIGGGSSIDTAKAACLIANLPERPTDLYEYGAHGNKMKSTLDRAVKLITLPTTAGTGAEATPSAVISDTKRNVKFSFANENETADMCIVDPTLTLGMPPRPTAVCGVDILAHAVECLVGTVQCELESAVLLECVERTWKWLPIAMKEPKDLEAREQLSWSAHQALCSCGIPNGHAVAHAIGSLYHITHGHACAMVLPTVVRHFAEASPEAIRDIAKRIGTPLVGDPAVDAGRVADAILDFNKRLGLTTFKETMAAKGELDDREVFIKKMIPAVLVDYKATQWLPPIHTGDYEAKIGTVCGMVYDEV